MRTETLLRLNKLIGSPRLKFAGALLLDSLGMRHLIVRFDPVLACNIRCGMCYFSDDNWLATHPVKRFSDDEVERLAAMFLPTTLQFHIGCGAEPTLYKNFPKLVALGKKYRVPFVGFTTNAQLLTADKSMALVSAGLDEITVSTHGVTRETYERMMKKASYALFHENLADLVKAKRNAYSNTPRIRVNYVVNPDNLDELRMFFPAFEEYNISTLQVRPIVDFGDTDYKKKDLRPFLADYNSITNELAEECHKRGLYFWQIEKISLMPRRIAPVLFMRRRLLDGLIRIMYGVKILIGADKHIRNSNERSGIAANYLAMCLNCRS